MRQCTHHGALRRLRAMVAAVMAAALVIALLCGRSSSAFAQGPAAGSVVTMQSVGLEGALSAGRTGSLVVAVRIARGWHINSDHPLASYYIPTRLVVSTPAHVAAGPVIYPPAQFVTLAFAGAEKLSVFTGTVEFKVPLSSQPGFAGNAAAGVELHYQACNDVQCLKPAVISTTADLAARKGVSATTDSAGATADSDQSADDGFGESSIAAAFAAHGYLLGLLIVMLGGLALNLTPCVYPLIGVTVAYFGNESGGPRKVIALASLYVLGIALMFSGVGVAVALSGGLFGAALQNPWVLGTIAAMILVLAASSFGLFSLRPPQWIMQRAGVARPGYLGALLMGLGMGVVAAPCIGPIVLGLLLMVQRSRSALFGFVLFFTLALGLGLPYIGLALAAGSIRRLPRSGEWLAWVEQLFGFILVGLALYFLDPIVPNRLISRLLPYYAGGVGVVLGFFSTAGREWRPFMIIRTAVGVLSAAALIYLLLPASGPRPQLSFEPFDPVSFEAAKAEGKPIIIDFSADWCVPCREMERTTFVDPDVIRAAGGFVRFRANLTAETSINEEIIRQFRVEGVPTTLFMDSAGAVRKRLIGYIGPAEFRSELEKLR